MMSHRGAPGSNAASGPQNLFRSSSLAQLSPNQDHDSVCVYDSSAYFIRESYSGREILMFGDVEPDSISLSPRNYVIWQEAAPRIANGNLKAIFIECSYDDSQTVDRLFGHLTPRFVVEELKVLAAEVEAIRQEPLNLDSCKKRKRDAEDDGRIHRMVVRPGSDTPVSPKTTRPPRRGSISGISDCDLDHVSTPATELGLKEGDRATTSTTLTEPQFAINALKNLKVVIIHVKEKFESGMPVGEKILQELLEHEEEAQLGCEFVISSPGRSFML